MTTVIPYAYAPPTAGDGDFITTFQAQCPAGQFWYNTFDVVPYAYITLASGESGLSWAARIFGRIINGRPAPFGH